MVDRATLIQAFSGGENPHRVTQLLEALTSFLQQESLEERERQWSTWLALAMSQRVAMPLPADERAAWGDLALVLEIDDALRLSLPIPGPFTHQTRFEEVSNSFFVSNCQLLLDVAATRLVVTSDGDMWHASDQVAGVAPRALPLVGKAGIRHLAEAAFARGIQEARHWVE